MKTKCKDGSSISGSTQRGFVRTHLSIQAFLPALGETLESELDENHRLFLEVCIQTRIENDGARYGWQGTGRPPASRRKILKAFVAKALWNHADTRTLHRELCTDPVLRRLCGWDFAGEIPSESTFSRAFAQFAADDLLSAVVARISTAVCGATESDHVCYDSTAIDAREKPAFKAPRAQPGLSRIPAQSARSADLNIADLPRQCDFGCKKNSKGKTDFWRGYKLHAATICGDIPICAFVSSASLHDSQAIIPLMQQASQRFRHRYDLADAGYDSRLVREFSRLCGRTPVIQFNNRFPALRPRRFTTEEKRIYKKRTAIERFFSHLHERHGGRTIRVRGAAKIQTHLLFGTLVILIEQFLHTLR